MAPVGNDDAPATPSLFDDTEVDPGGSDHDSVSFAREVIDIPVTTELSDSFLSYSLSVITARAIPDVRDGLKPVQRRILYAMADVGLRPDRPHRKSAGVVGETMGKYHPHGDSAIYDALTRMGQPFGRNVTLVDPHGNFGSLDDPPAAYRYTECRLSEAAMELLAEIDEDTVDFRPTFDGQRSEPVVLPGRLPNLLVNGTSGIAVGMATNMACHNLREVAEAIKLVLARRRPVPTTAELMEVLPGPDFPSGGIIVDDSLAEAIATGRGSFRIRARCEIHKLTRSRDGIVVTELPYLVGPERVVGRIQELMKTGRLTQVTDVKDLSDRKSGTRIEIECRPGANARAVLTELYRVTPLEDTFGVNNVVLVNGVPTTLGLRDLCQHYIDHRLEVIIRRTGYRLERARARLHIVEGLLIALDAIDLVVQIIRSSQDAGEARSRLMAELSLSEVQATHILDMQLRRLTALARLELVAEADELRSRIEELERILASEDRRRTIVRQELDAIVDAFGAPRRSRIVRAEELDDVSLEEVAAEQAAVDTPCRITLAASGLIGREPAEGTRPATFGRHDVIRLRIPATTHASLAAITSRGRTLSCSVAEIPEVTGRTRGVQTGDLFPLQKGEVVRHLVSTAPAGQLLEGKADRKVMLVTAGGMAKRLNAGDVLGARSGSPVITLKPGDTVVAAFDADDGTEAVLVSSNAQALRLAADTVSVQGRSAGGVAGMKLSDGAVIVGAGPLDPSGQESIIVLTVTDAQTAKVTDVEEIPVKGRATGGVRVTRFRDEKRLDWAYVGPDEGRVVVVGQVDQPGRPDAAPEPLTIPHTARDLVSRPVPRRYLEVGFGRW